MTRAVEAVPETVVRLRVNGMVIATWTCSPGELRPLAVGRLLALGFLDGAGDLDGIRVAEAGAIAMIDAAVRLERAAAGLQEREHRSRSGCGLRHFLDCDPSGLLQRGAERRRPEAPGADAFTRLFRALYERSPSRETTGGHHTAALSDGETLVNAFEEVGRHNAVDRAIGRALLDDVVPTGLGLLTTARISGEIAEHAARAGLAWIASRSVPTTLAVEIAGAAGIPVIARAAGREARVFAPPRR